MTAIVRKRQQRAKRYQYSLCCPLLLSTSEKLFALKALIHHFRAPVCIGTLNVPFYGDKVAHDNVHVHCPSTLNG